MTTSVCRLRPIDDQAVSPRRLKDGWGLRGRVRLLASCGPDDRAVGRRCGTGVHRGESLVSYLNGLVRGR